MIKKILLINPPETQQNDFSGPPLGLLYLAGTLLGAGFEVAIIDGCLTGWEAVAQKIKNFQPDLVGVPCLTPGRQKSLRAAQIVKQINPNILVVLGGAHATIMYRQLLENYPAVDICVLGEGEQTMLEIAQGRPWLEIVGLAFRKNGRVILTPPRKYVADLDHIPFPAWHLVDLQKYPPRGRGTINGVDLSREPRVSVIFSRGCVGRCNFCSTWWIWRGWRHRSAKNMADEIELLQKKYGVRHLCFADDTLTVKRQPILDLCAEIKRRKLQIAFHVTTRADCVDVEVLRALRSAGCYEIAYGIETGSAQLLVRMEKGVSPQVARQAIALTKEAGIKNTVLLIAGSLGETAETINKTVRFLRATNPEHVGSVGGLWILPGTRVYFEAKKAGLLGDAFWLGNQPFLLYTLEHPRWELAIFDWALRTKTLLSRWKIVNLIKAVPHFSRLFLRGVKSKLKYWFQK